MTSTGTCPRCGTPRYQETSAGLCPKCLGALGFGIEFDAGEADAIPARDKPRRLGDYELIEEIARGGMGVVYRARQVSLERIVALKVVLHGSFSSPEFVRRFRTEAAVVASLQHPHIVAVHEVGQADEEHFFSMDYIEGKSLAELIREQPVSARHAAQYLKTIAEAVHYAHERGVVHRDLKPSNVLIDIFDQPRITDFGLAKVLGTDAELTTTGQVLGSPAYIAPEQAAGRADEVGPASDIYSLGAILYHLLTGRPPFQGETLPQILLQVQEAEPVSPSRLNPGVPRDLQTICLKCLQKAPARRYETARELADELGRFLRREPIHARPVLAVERLFLWCKRRPVPAAMILALHLVVGLGALGILWQWRRAEVNARGERQQRRVAEQYSDRVRSQLYAGDVNFAARALQHGNLGLARRTLAAWQPGDGKPDLRGFEWFYLWSQCQGEQLATLGEHDWIVTCLAFSPDGRWLATGSQDQTVKIWEVAHRALITTLPAATGAVLSVAFTPDARQLVTGGLGGTRLWSCDTWRETTNYPGQIASVSRQRPLLATAEVSFLYWWQPPGLVRVWNYQSGAQVFQAPNVARVFALSPDGNTLAVAGLEHDINLWDVNSGELRQKLLTTNAVRGMTYSHNSERLIAILRGSVPMVFGVSPSAVGTAQAGRKLWGHTMDVWGVDFSPDDALIATTSSDQTLRLWEADTLSPRGTLRGHEHEVWCVAFSPDGELLATGSKDQTIKLWRKSPPATMQVFASQNSIKPFFSPGGDKIVVQDISRSSPTTVWLLSTNPSAQYIAGRRPMGFSSDGQALVRWGRGLHTLEFISLESTNRSQVVLAANWGDNSKALQYDGFSSDWKLFFAIDDSGQVAIWDAATGQLRTHLQKGPSGISAAAISRSGRWLALASRQERTLLLVDCETGAECKLTGHKDAIIGLDFSPDEQLLAGGSLDGTIRLWRTGTGELEATLPGHMEETTDVAFAPDGRTLASVNTGLSVKLWHLATRRELVSWDLPKAGTSVQFSPDGRHLAVTTSTNSVILFDAPLFNVQRPARQ